MILIPMHATTVIVSVAAALALHPHRHRLTLQLLITLLFTTQPHLRRHLPGPLGGDPVEAADVAAEGARPPGEDRADA